MESSIVGQQDTGAVAAVESKSFIENALAESTVTTNSQSQDSQTEDIESKKGYFDLENARTRSSSDVIVASRDPGLVGSIEVEEGSFVDSDAALLMLDDKEFVQQAKAAEAEWKIAVAEAENDVDLRYAVKSSEVSRQVLKRSENANRAYPKSVSKTEIEKLRLELKRAELSKEQAERTKLTNDLARDLKDSQRQIAQIRLDNRTVRSPIKGQVLEIFRQQGEWVGAGEPVARVARQDELKIVVSVKNAEDLDPNEIDLEKISFVIEIRGEEKEFPVHDVFVSPELQLSQGYTIKAKIDNSEGLIRPGAAGKIRVRITE